MTSERTKTPGKGPMGLEVLEQEPGLARVALTFKPELANIFGTLHGGATYWAMEEAILLASGHEPRQVDIHYLAPARPGDRIVARAELQEETEGMRLFQIKVTREADGVLLAIASSQAG